MKGYRLEKSMDIYESLINGNKKYGSNKEHICESNFKCKSFEIN